MVMAWDIPIYLPMFRHACHLLIGKQTFQRSIPLFDFGYAHFLGKPNTALNGVLEHIMDKVLISWFGKKTTWLLGISW